MKTLFAISPDGTRVAYDRSGFGPAVILLHGGGSSRQDWHEAGYVSRLKEVCTVITIDLRGHGQSGLPVEPEDYAINKIVGDVLAVADACGVENFTVWGFSYGSKISRYLAVQSDRVTRLVLMSAQLGPGVSGKLREDAINFCAHWPSILQAQRDGTLDLASLSPNDQDLLSRFNVPVMLAWVRAMLDWPSVGPEDLRCPTLWLVGSEDAPAVANLEQYRALLKGFKVQVRIFADFNHMQVFDEIDIFYPLMLSFSGF